MSSRRAAPPSAIDSEQLLAKVTERLATNVRERRRAAGLSQERLAETARVSAIYVGQVERAKASNPSLGVVVALAAALGCEVADLLTIPVSSDE